MRQRIGQETSWPVPGLPPEELPNYLPDVWKRDLMAEQRAALNAHHASLARGIVK
jgi:hypothetical protein